MSQVEEFMAKPHQTYACGKNIHEVKKELVKAFVGSSKEKKAEERGLFEKALNLVGLAPKGAEVLKDLEKIGYTFAFEQGNFGGACNPGAKQIIINPNFGMDYMLQAIVHEGTHALQFERRPADYPALEKMNAASFFKACRAIEADAVAHENAFIWQMKDIRPSLYQEAHGRTAMMDAFETEMNKSGEEKKAMQASFKAWYIDDYYRNFYDENHRELMGKICDYGKSRNDPTCFSQSVSAKDVLKICLYKGEPYVKPQFLEAGLPYSVDVSQRPVLQGMINDYAAHVGVKPDQTLNRMALRDFMGKLIAPAAPVQKAVIQKAQKDSK